MTNELTNERQAIRDLFEKEGAPKAYRALVRVLDDPKATPQALATAARTMLQGPSYLASEGDEGKEPHEMSAAELQQRIDRMRREVSDRARPVIEGRRVTKNPGGVFD